MESRVLVPIDESPPAQRALEFALAEYPTAAITIMVVIGIPDADTYQLLTVDQSKEIDEIQQKRYQHAQHIIESAEETATGHRGEISSRIVAGMLAETIINYAEETDPDYLVIGLNERSTASRILSKSVTETVAEKAPVPVIVIK
jgi:nucleotide-binding universal stress UspA family protein